MNHPGSLYTHIGQLYAEHSNLQIQDDSWDKKTMKITGVCWIIVNNITTPIDNDEDLHSGKHFIASSSFQVELLACLFCL